MAIVIRKKISLEFLGDEYKDSFIIVSSIPVKDYDTFQQSEQSVKDVVSEHFLEGQIQQGSELITLTKENLDELPGEVFVTAFEEMIGQLSPKVESN